MTYNISNLHQPLDYCDKNETIHSIFEKRVEKEGDCVALQYKDTVLTNSTFNNESNKIAHFLIKQGVKIEDKICILQDRSQYLYTSLMGILKSGAAYLPVDPLLPSKRIEEILNDSEAVFVLTNYKYLQTVENLLWKCKSIKGVLIVDSHLKEVSQSIKIEQKQLWENISRNGNDLRSVSGWVNSYTNKIFAEDEILEMVNNIKSKLCKNLCEDSKILEIGCGSGILIKHFAQLVKSYHGIDISSEAVKFARKIIDEENIKNVELSILSSDEIDSLLDCSYDIIIVNSVIQFFPNLEYLKLFIERCSKKLKNNGVIFIGDIRDLELQKIFYTSLYKNSDKLSIEQFIENKYLQNSELFVPKSFFNFEFETTISDKIGNISNELTKFRYDIIIKPFIKSKKQNNKYIFYKDDLFDSKSTNPLVCVKSSNLAYIIYTSGSTGKPKGVMIEHASLINRLQWMQKLLNSNTEVFLQKTPYTFDVSVWEIFLWIFSSSILIALPQGDEKSPKAITNYIKNFKITVIHFVPAMLELFTEYLKINKIRGNVNSIKFCFCSGEELNINQVEQIKTQFVKSKLYNLYGPTEATIDVSYFDCSKLNKNSTVVPIGKSIDNCKLFIFNNKNQLCDIDEEGDLYIGGICLARGYLNRAELNAEKFNYHKNLKIRLYKTGDIAKLDKNGDIIYIGRSDFQIKLRGYRIELGQIEESMRSIIGVDTCVAKLERINGENALIVYYSGIYIDSTKLKQHLLKDLPEYMVPLFYIYVIEFPLTSHGKIDRNLLLHNKFIDKDSKLNKNELSDDNQLAKIWCSVLNLNYINEFENFFTLGGHSLKVIQVINLIKKNIGIEIDVKEFFNNPTFNQIINLIENKHSLTSKKIITKSFKITSTLSNSQRKLWYIYKFNPNCNFFNVLNSHEIKGKLNLKSLKKAFKCVIDKNAILRVNFKEKGGVPYQFINKNFKFKFKIIESQFNNKIQIKKFSDIPFKLEKDSLIQILVIKNSKEDFTICTKIHHILCDGKSIKIINKEIEDLYFNIEAKNLYPVSNVYDHSFFDFIDIETNKDLLITKKNERFWLKYLKDCPNELYLPYDKVEKANQISKSKVYKIKLKTKICKKINSFNFINKKTNFIFFISSWIIFLHKISSSNDIITGFNIENREDLDFENSIGFFANSLAIRTKVNKKLTFKELIDFVEKDFLEIYSHQGFSFEQLNRDSKGTIKNISLNSLFSIMFAYYQDNRDHLNLYNTTNQLSSTLLVNTNSNLALTIIEKESEYFLEIQYNSQLFDNISIKRMCSQFETMLNNIVNDNSTIEELSIISDKEKKLLLSFSGNGKEVDNKFLLHSFLEYSANKYPNSIALKYNDKIMSYGEVNSQCNKTAQYLISIGIKNGDTVCMYFKPSLETIIAMYAILKAGAVYVPIDIEMYQSRVNEIITKCNSKYLITNIHTNIFDKLNITVINTEDCSVKSIINEQPNDNLQLNISTSDSAYIIFTSGTTGEPKGIICTHEGAGNTTYSAKNIFELRSFSRILQAGNITFDTSVWEINLAFLTTSTLIIPDKRVMKNFDELNNLLISEKIDYALFFPSLLKHINVEKTKLNFIESGGEAIDSQLVNSFIDKKFNYFNAYGPTEISIVATICKISKKIKNGKVPIGKPINGMKVYVLNQDKSLTPLGLAGEIYISGIGLSKGYIGNQTLTDSVFLDNPFESNSKIYKTGDLAKFLPNGNLLYLGRKDKQVKIRGFRVELSEIENCILHIDNILEVKVIVVCNDPKYDDSYIVAFYTSKNNLDSKIINLFLSNNLPYYMIPRKIIFTEIIPKKINGKYDENQLSKIACNNFDVKSIKALNKSSDVIGTIIYVLQGLLENANITSEDNFFKIGGDSMLVLRAIYILKTEYDIVISAKDFYNSKNIYELSMMASKFKKDKSLKKIIRNNNKPILIECNVVSNVYENVFLTGSTGFFGCFILRELTLNISVKKIYVLIRGDNKKVALTRLKSICFHYFGDSFNYSKIIIFNGDITKTNLGLSNDDQKNLTENTNLVIHSAANVNHIGYEKDFYNTNIFGTKNIIDFAKKCKKSSKLVFISTVSVSGNNIQNINKFVYKESDFNLNQDFANLYEESKFNAEELVYKAIEDGLNCTIFRIGNLTGETKKGIFQKNISSSAFYNLFKILVETKNNWGIHSTFNLSPVDITANFMLQMLLKLDTDNKVFHLINNNNLEINQIMKFIEVLRKSEQPIQDKPEKLDSLKELFEILDKSQTIIEYDSSYTRNQIKKINLKWNKNNLSYFKKILQYTQKIKFIK